MLYNMSLDDGVLMSPSLHVPIHILIVLELTINLLNICLKFMVCSLFSSFSFRKVSHVIPKTKITIIVIVLVSVYLFV